MPDIKKKKLSVENYNSFSIDYEFRNDDDETKNLFENKLKKLNSLQFSKFKTKLVPKFMSVENIFPEFETHMNLSFEKYKLIIGKNMISVLSSSQSPIRMRDPRMLMSILRYEQMSGTDIKIDKKELSEIEDFLRLILIGNLFEIQENIKIEDVLITSIINLNEKLDFSDFNENLADTYETNVKVSNMDLRFQEKEDIYIIGLENKGKNVLSYGYLKGEAYWNMPIIELLSKNIDYIEKFLTRIIL